MEANANPFIKIKLIFFFKYIHITITTFQGTQQVCISKS